MNYIWCSRHCTCQECKSYEECEPCSGDWDYEHPCPGKCINFKSNAEGDLQESEDKK